MKLLWCTIVLTGLSISTVEAEMYAYHTKVQHSATDYLSEVADIIVVLDEGQLEFTRQTNYLPLWRFKTGTQRVDDLFPGRDVDAFFDYSYVRLIKNTPEEILIHWRYIPDIDPIIQANQEKDPLVAHGFTGVVHEFYHILPNGSIKRIVKDANNTSADDWADSGLGISQMLTLTNTGIDHGRVDRGFPEDDEEEGEDEDKDENEDMTTALFDPIRKWSFDGSFDEGGVHIFEDIQEDEVPVLGRSSIFKDGVRGSALTFDGYYTGIPVRHGFPELKNSMSLSSWIALDVYPYNEAPIIHLSEDFGKQGFYLGLDAYGYPFFRLNGKTAQSKEKIPLYQWQHISVSVSKGKVNLFQNGKLTATAKARGSINLEGAEGMIGLNTTKARCTDYVRDFPQNIPFIFGIQAVLDELTVYDKALTAAELNQIYISTRPKDINSPIEKGVLPGEMGIADEFGAYYKTLPFQDIWDSMWRLSDYADVVVKFDHIPTSVIYWHGSNYSANWITDNNRWMSDQSSEIWGPHGCSEHMADKQVRHSYARIIENTPARVVVHWRYPCVDVGYVCTDKLNWTDEFHTIYPDGTGIRKVNWNKVYERPGFQDIQFFTNPGETALDVVDLHAMTVANTEGDIEKLIWEKPNKVPKINIENAHIELLHSKSQYKIFVVFQGGNITPWGHVEQSQYTDDPFAGPWNHWPMHFVPSDGRFAVDTDRVTHFALGANDWAPEFGSTVFYGFTDQGIEAAIPKARYWKNPPVVSSVKGAKSMGFDKDQKAFLFDASSQKISFKVEASKQSPVINPCFVVKHWSGGDEGNFKMGGKNVNAEQLRQGIHRDTDGTRTLVLWLDHEFNSPVDFGIR